MNITSILKFLILTSSICSAFIMQPKFPSITKKRININTKVIKMKIQQSNNNKPISWSKDKGILLFDIPATPEIWAIALVYFVQGLFSICRLALSFYYKDTLHLSLADLTIISSISAIPWIIKPLYGFISDTFPLFGYKRKSYLILSGLIGTISWGLLANLALLINNGQIVGDANSVIYSVGLVTLSSLGLAFSDVLVDAMVVSKSRDQNKAGSLQSICWSSSSIGGIISAYFSGYLLQKFGTTFVFSLTAIVPLIMITTAGLIKEEKIEQSNYYIGKTQIDTWRLLKLEITNIMSILSQKSILYPLMFLMILNITPSSGSALFYFEVNKLGFQPEFFGKLGLVSSISSLFGIVLYNQKLKSIPLRTIFKWTCILGTILGMSPLILVTQVNKIIGISDEWFAIIDDIVLSIFGQITFMPILVLAAKMCPPGVEAMLYATIMSANNLSGNIGRLLGGLLTQMMGITNDNFTNLPWLLVLTNLSGLIPLMFLNLIPDETKNNDKK
jgi:folate/biopterin transporter